MSRSSRRYARVAVSLALSSVAFASPAAAQGRFSVSYAPPPPEMRELVDALRQPGLFEEAAGFVNSALVLPRDVPIVFDSCEVANAFYDPAGKRIVFCYQFIELFAQMFTALPDQSEDELGQAIVGTTLFFLLHEMGHALVNVLELPITGREEDAVDDLAALISLEAEADADLLAAADGFALLADSMEANGGQLAFWDEHSLSAQRAYALTCIVYGSDPERYQDLVSDEFLPESRAVRCPAEYAQKSASWDRILEDHYTPEWRQ